MVHRLRCLFSSSLALTECLVQTISGGCGADDCYASDSYCRAQARNGTGRTARFFSHCAEAKRATKLAAQALYAAQQAASATGNAAFGDSRALLGGCYCTALNLACSESGRSFGTTLSECLKDRGTHSNRTLFVRCKDSACARATLKGTTDASREGLKPAENLAALCYSVGFPDKRDNARQHRNKRRQLTDGEQGSESSAERSKRPTKADDLCEAKEQPRDEGNNV
jgi:hypothetical protein